MLPMSCLKVPRLFARSLPSKTYSYEYPQGHYEVAYLYVAAKHRNVNLNDIDFVFGGSALHMLATHDTTNPYMVCRVPSTKNTILVGNRKSYSTDYSDDGFQFKRFVTTGYMDYTVDKCTEYVEHMHILQIGNNFQTLMCVEADGIDEDGNTLKIKSLKPRNWGTKMIFQMISNGSPNLCCGIKDRNVLSGIKIRSLSDVAADSLRYLDVGELEQNIIDGMKAIQDQMQGANEDDIFKISFDSSGNLHLQRSITRSSALLPPATIVKDLLE